MEEKELERLTDLHDKRILTDAEFQRLKERATGEPSERKRLATGLHLLDTRLGGGIMSGSTVAFTADPLAMPEVFLYQFSEARRTVYFTTDRKAEYIREDLASSSFEPGEVDFVDIYSQHFLDSHGKLRTGGSYEDRRTVEFVMERVKRVRGDEKEVNIIFDTFSFFEELEMSKRQIHLLLNYVYEMTKSVNGLTYLLSTSSTEWFNQLLESSCDVVMKGEVVDRQNSLGKRLYIPKLRGGTPPESGIKYAVDAETGIQVDTSRLV